MTLIDMYTVNLIPSPSTFLGSVPLSNLSSSLNYIRIHHLRLKSSLLKDSKPHIPLAIAQVIFTLGVRSLAEACEAKPIRDTRLSRQCTRCCFAPVGG